MGRFFPIEYQPIWADSMPELPFAADNHAVLNDKAEADERQRERDPDAINIWELRPTGAWVRRISMPRWRYVGPAPERPPEDLGRIVMDLDEPQGIRWALRMVGKQYALSEPASGNWPDFWAIVDRHLFEETTCADRLALAKALAEVMS